MKRKAKDTCPLCGQPAPARQTFAETVKWARMKRQMTLQEFAKPLGVAASTISRIERGQSPNLTDFYLLCQHLNLETARWLTTLIPAGKTVTTEHER